FEVQGPFASLGLAAGLAIQATSHTRTPSVYRRHIHRRHYEGPGRGCDTNERDRSSPAPRWLAQTRPLRGPRSLQLSLHLRPQPRGTLPSGAAGGGRCWSTSGSQPPIVRATTIHLI